MNNSYRVSFSEDELLELESGLESMGQFHYEGACVHPDSEESKNYHTLCGEWVDSALIKIRKCLIKAGHPRTIA